MPVEIYSPRDQAVRILAEAPNGTTTRDDARAQSYATLAVADAIDRLTETIREEFSQEGRCIECHRPMQLGDEATLCNHCGADQCR